MCVSKKKWNELNKKNADLEGQVQSQQNKKCCEELKYFSLDTKSKSCSVNGRDISKTAHYVSLTFENGKWSLEIEETNHYTDC